MDFQIMLPVSEKKKTIVHTRMSSMQQSRPTVVLNNRPKLNETLDASIQASFHRIEQNSTKEEKRRV